MVDWSLLPEDLLLEIAKCLKNHFDVLHFRSVCTTWRASAPSNLRPRPSFSSRFFLPKDKAGRESFVSYCTVCLFKFPANSSSHSIPRFCFLKLEKDSSGKIRIVHPLFLREKLMVEYPIVLDISKLHVQEVIRQYSQVYLDNYQCEYDVVAMKLDPSNNDDDCPLVVLERNGDVRFLTFSKAGDEEATTIEVGGGFGSGIGYARYDSIQFERKFYVVELLGTTVCVDPFSRTSFMVEKTLTVHKRCKFYLVELCGNLLLVEAVYESTPSSSAFEVFQLDGERKRWNRLQSLGDGILFLGFGSKFSASAIPAVEGNCIIFGHMKGVRAMEEIFVFHMSNRIIVPLEQCPDLLQLFRPPFHTG